MTKHILGLFSVLLLASNLFAADSAFDRVAYENDLVQEPVGAGFGTLALINDLFGDETLRNRIVAFMKFGRLDVKAQKLPAITPNHSKTLRYTLETWVRTGFTSRRQTGTMVIDCNSLIIIADGGPTECVVVEMLLNQ